MKKLGCVIKKVSGGLTSIFECNLDEWSKKCTDIRDYLNYFDGIEDFNNFVTLISFDEKGCFLTILKPISGRPGDCLIAYIYISNSIKITGEQLEKVYKGVKKCLLEDSINNDILNKLFSTEYETNDIIVSYTPSPSQCNRFGYRYIGGRFSFEETLGEDRYQIYYSDYKAIFILESDNRVKISETNKNNFVDLTQYEIVNNCILHIDQSHLGPDVSVMVNGKEFNQGQVFKMGDKVQLQLERPGFKSYDKLHQIEINERVKTVPLPNDMDWEIYIKPEMFIIKDEEGEIVENPNIQVKGKQISWGGSVFKEKDLQKDVPVTVEAVGFEKYSQELRLQIPDGVIQIELRRKTNKREYDIRLANGRDAKMSLESKYLFSNIYENESPIIGYSLSYRRLDPSDWYIWKQRLIGFGAAIVLFLMIYLCMTLAYKLGFNPSKSDTHNNDYFHNEIPSGHSEIEQEELRDNPIEAVSESGASHEDAIKYLDSNKIWSKSSMEQFLDLKGLFDDMNKFNLDSILDNWKSKLSESKNFKKVCDSADKNHRNGWNPQQDPHNPTYNKPGDEKINIINYINWLDQDRTLEQKKQKNRQNSKVSINNDL